MHFPTGGRVNSPDQRLYFLDPKMRLLSEQAPPTPRLPPEPAEALVRENEARGVEPDFLTSAARYKREGDIPQTIFIRALEALEELKPVA